MLLVLMFAPLQTALADLPPAAKQFLPESELVGEGRLSFLFWDVYDASLYSPQGIWESERPYALKLSYLMNFKGADIADRSIEEMESVGCLNREKKEEWRIAMRDIFPNVNKGSSLTGIRLEDGSSVFLTQDGPIGTVNDAEFSQCFFDIWLHQKTSEPKLRKKLLGG